MNSSSQAKSGLKTFIITFGISVVVFGTLYAVVTAASTGKVSIEQDTTAVEKVSYVSNTIEDEQVNQKIQDVTTEAKQNTQLQGDVAGDSTISPFAQLASDKPEVESKSVLAGSDQSTQSTVPGTGVTSITFGVISTMLLVFLFVYIIVNNPRKYALSKFEKDVLDELD